MRKARRVLPALVLVAAVAGTCGGKLLYEETVTITLDDGTQVMLVLDDHGMKRPAPTAASQRFQQAKFDYLKRLRDAKDRYWKPYQLSTAKAASNAQKERSDQLQANQGSMAAKLGRLRNHAQGKMLWNLQSTGDKHYYYLPPPPSVARDADGKPEFLFMKFTSDRSEEEGGVSGGILHFLCEYGLTPDQEAELEQKLASKVRGAKLMGAVPMQSGEGESTFRVISAVLSDAGFTQKVVASGKAPLLPGQKVAAAARLDPAGAVLIEESLKRPTSDISVEFSLAYTAFLPAFDGRITFDWERFKAHVDDWKMKYTNKKSCKWWIFGCSRSYTRDELREIYDFMCENEVIRVEWTEAMVDERLEMIRQAFFRFMESSFFDKSSAEFLEEDEPNEGETVKPGERGRSSTFNRYVAKSEEAFTNKTIRMKVNLPVEVEYVTVGNISSSWYNSARRQHPELFAEINVDDPFFQQRRVAFHLDLDAVEIFDDAINFVTVEVKKDRPGDTRDFHTSFTLNKRAVTEHGPMRTITYAKMRDDSPEVFEYLVRWSLRGGVEWPANPDWREGEWEGVTLRPPVVPLNVEAEADLAELDDLGFTRATVEVRYTQFGERTTDRRSLHLSVAKTTPIESMMIFRDRDDTDWQYRINFYHKRLGRKRGSWTEGGEDGYIYCVVPGRLRTEIKARDALADTIG